MNMTNCICFNTLKHDHRCKLTNCNEKIAVINIWRKLWEQHVMWTRSLIISKVDNLGDIDPVTARLLRNPIDMGNQLKAFFCPHCVETFVRLFEGHLLLAAQLVDAAIAGDADLVVNVRREWFRNADEIANLLHRLFLVESEENWRNMMHRHLEITELEAVLRIEKRYVENVAIYDTIETQALEMSDMIAKGIIRQFIK